MYHFKPAAISNYVIGQNRSIPKKVWKKVIRYIWIKDERGEHKALFYSMSFEKGHGKLNGYISGRMTHKYPW